MLVDDGEGDDGLACAAEEQQVGSTDPEFGAAREDGVDGVLVGHDLAESDVEAGFAVIALGDGGVIAGELKLVLPLQLQRDVVEVGDGSLGAGGRGRRREPAAQADQKCAAQSVA